MGLTFISPLKVHLLACSRAFDHIECNHISSSTVLQDSFGISFLQHATLYFWLLQMVKMYLLLVIFRIKKWS